MVDVRRGASHVGLADERILIGQHSRRCVGVFQDTAAARRVVHKVLEEVDRTAEHRLGAQRTLRGIDASIPEHADVVGAAVGFNAVVAHVVHVVVVEVDRHRQPVLDRIRRAVGLAVGRDIDCVVPVCDVVVGHDVTLPVHLDPFLGEQQFGVPGKA